MAKQHEGCLFCNRNFTFYWTFKKRYIFVFQMYGEKVEEAEELRLDLSDVKEMYKVQIQDLLKSAMPK